MDFHMAGQFIQRSDTAHAHKPALDMNGNILQLSVWLCGFQ